MTVFAGDFFGWLDYRYNRVGCAGYQKLPNWWWWLWLFGGILWFEWGNTGLHATTFGSVVNSFQGEIKDALSHKLVHTRQYFYFPDWLSAFYFTVAGLWGLISSVASPSFRVDIFFWLMARKSLGIRWKLSRA